MVWNTYLSYIDEVLAEAETSKGHVSSHKVIVLPANTAVLQPTVATGE